MDVNTIYDEEVADQRRRALERQQMLQQQAYERAYEEAKWRERRQPAAPGAGMPIEQAIETVLAQQQSGGRPFGPQSVGVVPTDQIPAASLGSNPYDTRVPLPERMGRQATGFHKWLDGEISSQPFAWRWLDNFTRPPAPQSAPSSMQPASASIGPPAGYAASSGPMRRMERYFPYSRPSGPGTASGPFVLYTPAPGQVGPPSAGPTAVPPQQPTPLAAGARPPALGGAYITWAPQGAPRASIPGHPTPSPIPAHITWVPPWERAPRVR